MSRTPQPIPSFWKTVPVLKKAARQIDRAVKAAHPERGCLPVPRLRAPDRPGDVPRYLAYLQHGLFDDDGYRHPAWDNAATSCSHLAAEHVRLIYEVTYWWYETLRDLERYLTPGQEEDVFNSWHQLREPRGFYGHFARDLNRLILLTR
ncbi:hypothetical protein [Nonomuraea sp. NPDC049400]|uniref:hypothetical protein n=1 Tax=Nonomuraea sp. NPDC049400 TaxID=3364352 RepID=UPI0037B4DF5F